MSTAAGTQDDPWELTTAPGSSTYSMYTDPTQDPPELVCRVGSTTLRYQRRAVEDLAAWLGEQDDWVPLGAADEKKTAAPGSVEAWGRSPDNPVGGGTASGPVTGVASGCTCRRCWRRWGSPS